MHMTFTFVTLFLWKVWFYCKNTNLCWIAYQILCFSTYNLNICYFFRKSTSTFLNFEKIKVVGSFENPPVLPWTLRVFSKTHQSSLTLKGGSTSHLGLLPSGEKRKPLLLVAQNRYAIRLADHQRSTPAAELRFFVRDKPQGHGGAANATTGTRWMAHCVICW